MTIRRAICITEKVETLTLTDRLARFRKQVESESGEPLQNLDVNAALFLSDLCRFIGLGHRQHYTVLGPTATDFLVAMEETAIQLTKKH